MIENDHHNDNHNDHHNCKNGNNLTWLYMAMYKLTYETYVHFCMTDAVFGTSARSA